MREQIPGFVLQPPNSRELQRLRAAARVNIQLTREAVNVVGATDIVQNAVGNTPEALREAENEWSQWRSVEGELRSVLRGLNAANVIRQYELAQAVRKAYKIGRTLAEEESFSQLQPHVETMFRVRNGKRTKTTPPPDEPVEQ